MTKATRHAGAALAVILAATPALAGDVRVPEDQSSLAAAAAVAGPGDRIVLHGAVRIHEAQADSVPVVFPDDVTLLGGSLRAEATLIGDGLTLERVVVRGSVSITGDDVTVDRCALRGAELSVEGDRARIVRCRGVDSSPHVSGDDAVFKANRGALRLFVQGDRAVVARNAFVDAGPSITGTDATVARNRLRGRTDTTQISVQGVGARVIDNRVAAARRQGIGIAVWGGRTTISRNVVVRAQDAIVAMPLVFPSAPSTVTANRVLARGPVSADRYGHAAISVVGDVEGTLVAGNRVVCTTRGGIMVEAPGATVTDNRVDGGDSSFHIDFVGTGLRVVGAAPRVARNVVRLASGAFDAVDGHGLVVVGDAALVEDNRIVGAPGHGIVMDGSGTVARNRVESPSGHGIAVTGPDVILTDDVILGPRQDGLYLRGTAARVEDVTVRAAGGVGAFVHAAAGSTTVRRTTIEGCRTGGLFADAADLVVELSHVVRNGAADLIERTPITRLDATDYVTTAVDVELSQESRDAWFESRIGSAQPLVGRVIEFSMVGITTPDADWDRLALRSDRSVVRRPGIVKAGDESVVVRLDTSEFESIWTFVAESGIGDLLDAHVDLGEVEISPARGLSRHLGPTTHPATDQLHRLLTDAVGAHLALESE